MSFFYYKLFKLLDACVYTAGAYDRYGVDWGTYGLSFPAAPPSLTKCKIIVCSVTLGYDVLVSSLMYQQTIYTRVLYYTELL
jgi:hypothetical protein